MAKMNEVRQLMINWYTSGTNSKHDPTFVSFSRKFRNGLIAELSPLGATNFDFNYGHYYISGFFTMPSGQIYYFSISDVRHFRESRLLYRTAKHYKDWTGGQNQYVEVENGMAKNMRIK
jgi:hypothetical protein